MKKTFKRFPILQGMKIRQKFLLLVTALIIPVLSISYFIYVNITDRLTESQLILVKQGYSQFESFLNYRIERIFLASSIIAMDSTLNDILAKNPATYSFLDQYRDVSIIKTYLSQFQSKNNVNDNLRLYIPGAFMFSSEEKLLFSLDAAKDTLWYKNTFRDWGWVTCNPPAYVENHDAISIVRPIRDLNHYRRFIGAVRIDISIEEIQQILSRVNISPRCLSYIAFSDGNLAGASSYDLLCDLRLNEENLMVALSSQNFVKLDIQGQKCWAYANYLNNTDIILITVLPEDELANEIHLVQRYYILALSSLVLLFIIFILPSINSITRRIRQLVGNMKLVENGNLNVKMYPRNHDEIGLLGDDFNSMVKRIDALMKKQYMLGQELKTAELKALQSQINPHFLYNTLELMGWMAYKSNPKEIQFIANSLAQFYRLSLNHGNDISSIADELKLVESYLHIQSVRFRNNLSVEINVKDIKDYSIPKITLQPIVENSILHGILEKDNKSGTIKIKGELKENNIIELIVEDNGVGMTEAQIRKLLDGQGSAENVENYGLHNIEMRICLYFAINKAIHIESKPGTGTRVIIHFPPVPYHDRSD